MSDPKHLAGFLSRRAGVAALATLLAWTSAALPPSPGADSSSTNRFDFPAIDPAAEGGTRLIPAPGDASADLSPDLPMPLGPASSVGGMNPESGSREWIVAPIPFLKPTFGWGVALGAGCIYQPFRNQSQSPPWISGVGSFYTENQSWGVGGGHKMNLANDLWRVFGGGGYADLHYDFYGIGSEAGDSGQAVALNQRVSGGKVEVLRQVAGNWYAGLTYLFAHSRTRLDSTTNNLPANLTPDAAAMDAHIGAIGPHVQRDTRDSQFYPTRGSLLDVSANLFAPAIGSDFSFQAYELSYDHYLNLATNHVLAVRGYGRVTSGRVPYFALCSFGSKGNLRGYTPGRYRDKMMLSAQAEYRWRLTDRFGAVAFAGIGGVAPEFDDFDTLLPSGGVGVRYVLAKRNNVSLRFDTAWGRNDHAFYFGVGEAF